MPRKLIDLIRDLENSGFYEINGGGKGSHRKFNHPNFKDAVTLSGNLVMMLKFTRRNR